MGANRIVSENLGCFRFLRTSVEAERSNKVG
jgi:hypothetical protein